MSPDILTAAPAMPMSHMDDALLALLHSRSTAALGTRTQEGDVAVSLVPYAIDPVSGAFVILISGLAAHTRQLQHHPRASLLVCDSEDRADNVHAIARVSLDVEASWPAADSAQARHASGAYLARHPAAMQLTQLPDFRWVCLHPRQARHVAGFGAARTIDQIHIFRLIVNHSSERR